MCSSDLISRCASSSRNTTSCCIRPGVFDVRARPALLLKDVVSTGVIENYLIGHLRSQGASQVRLAAIIDRTDQRTTDVVVDYSLFAVPRGHFAGYGMEYQGGHAQLPYIAEVSGPSSGAAAGQ